MKVWFQFCAFCLSPIHYSPSIFPKLWQCRERGSGQRRKSNETTELKFKVHVQWHDVQLSPWDHNMEGLYNKLKIYFYKKKKKIKIWKNDSLINPDRVQLCGREKSNLLPIVHREVQLNSKWRCSALNRLSWHLQTNPILETLLNILKKITRSVGRAKRLYQSWWNRMNRKRVDIGFL